MYLKSLIIIAFVAGITTFGAVLAAGINGKEAAKLPKIGERHYVIEGADRYAPVSIRPATTDTGGKYLKDPVQPAKGVRVEVAKPVVRKAAGPKVASSKPSHLRFRKLNVAGHLNQPRVEFSRDLLQVDRADEPLTQDFYQKVFLPAQDDKF